MENKFTSKLNDTNQSSNMSSEVNRLSLFKIMGQYVSSKTVSFS